VRVSFVYSAPTTRKLDRHEWRVSECANCGHQFVNPQPTWKELEPYYNKEYVAYDPMHGAQGSDDDELARAKETGLIRFIPVPAGLRLLDVGCGGGWFLRLCKKLGAIEQGVEPSRHAAEMAAAQGLHIFQGTLEDYIGQVPSGTQFDVITASHVIEHTPNPVSTLSAMKRLLAPDGYIWIAVPNATYPIARFLKGRWHSTDLPYHLMQFTAESMSEAGRRAGLKVRGQRTESQPPHVAASISQLLRYRCFVPYRLSIRSRAVHAAARWYSQRVDAKRNGEGLLTEFVAA
jgi:2-polyprenyl-3-methyl-5-hydroxy-6-metoxy-1,4-benzoquinol methylase